MAVRIKICGLTNAGDALAAAALGADVLGFVLAKSPRRVSVEEVREIVRVLPPTVTTVGVLVDEPPQRVADIREAAGLDAVQILGDYTREECLALGGPRRVIRTWRVGRDGPPPEAASFDAATVHLDTAVPGMAGGTGKTFAWPLARELAARRFLILAGGLTPENVTRALAQAGPSCVDVSSGVEASPGRKDHERIREFIRAVRQAG